MPLAIYALTAGAFGIGVTEFVVMGLLLKIGADFHVSIAAAGLLISGYALGVVIGAPLLTTMTGRWPRKSVLMGLMAIFTIGNAACALAPGYGLLMAARVLTAFAHGTFFGVGSVVAAGLVAADKRASAIAMMFTGLTVANVLGVPFGTWLGLAYGWRATFWAVTASGLIALIVIATVVPRDAARPDAGDWRADLATMRRPPVLLGLLTTTLGYAGVFAVFTYIAPLLTQITGFAEAAVSPILLIFGVGLVAGNLFGGRLADRYLVPTVIGSMLTLSLVLGLMTLALHNRVSAIVFVGLLGASAFATVPPLQMWVMEKARGAGQSLASSFNIAAFNLGNALGAWLGGIVIVRGPGLGAVPWVAALLPLCAVGVAAAAIRADRVRCDPSHAKPAQKAATEPASWVATWTASPQPTWGADFAFPTTIPAVLHDQTIRQVARLSIGGKRVRIALSNEYGTQPLVIGAAHVALAEVGSAIVSGTDRSLSFGGNRYATVPEGAQILSDPVDLAFGPLTSVVVSIYLPRESEATTFHWDGRETTYLANGNQVAAKRIDTDNTTDARIFLSAIQVEASADARAVVVIGDSITDGNGATVNANTRWPDFLAERLAHRNIAVLNAGISGARLLSDKMGVNALARFDRDVLSQPHVNTAVVLLGINDISWPGTAFDPDGVRPSADVLIAGYRQLIARARARGVRIIGATLTPFEGALPDTPLDNYYNKDKDGLRRQINAWMRSGGEFDAVIDFDLLLTDPTHPGRLTPEFDSGDHLHPGDRGNRAMADAIDLDCLFPAGPFSAPAAYSKTPVVYAFS